MRQPPYRVASRLYRRISRATTSLVAVALLATVGLWVPSISQPASAALPNPPSNLRTAYYFGTANPQNFWSSDLSGAQQAFEQMKANGFNAVGLVIPWGYFQTKTSPPTKNKVAFKELDRLISLAAGLDMQVVLRISYLLDEDPADRPSYTQRALSVWSNQTEYNAWLAYISALHANVSHFGNIAMAYLSWEDFFNPVGDATVSTAPGTRVRLAQRYGYQTWLSQHYSLAAVSFAYGQQFSSWSQVPTPLRNRGICADVQLR